MIKIKTKKIIMIVLIISLITLLGANVIAEKIQYAHIITDSDLVVGNTIDLEGGYSFYDNDQLYCAECGGKFSSVVTYKVQNKYTITYQPLAYTLYLASRGESSGVRSVTDTRGGKQGKDTYSFNWMGAKQQLLWYYFSEHYSDYGTDTQAQALLSQVGHSPSDTNTSSSMYSGEHTKYTQYVSEVEDMIANGNNSSYNYSAEVWFLKGQTETQMLIYVKGSRTAAAPKNTDVSLQKYITHKNGSNVYNRENKGSGSPYGYITADRVAGGEDNVYKCYNPVEISAGDTVTYKIEIYNNSTVEATSVEVIDELPSYVSVDSIYKGSFTSVSEQGNGTILGQKSNLSGGASAYFTITLKFDTYQSEAINIARISSVTPTNNTSYRTEDSDFVKMQKLYQASIEKYISAVNGSSISGRNGLQTYGYSSSTSDDIWNKQNYPQAVEKGDTVTYTIKLKNTGTDSNTYGDISSIVVTDNGSSGNLQYESSTGVSVSGSEFTYSGTITPGDYATFTITYTVISSSYGSAIENFASIKSIDGSAASNVDNDGLWNNGDRDWIELKQYKLAVEKYVHQLNGNGVPSREGHPAEYGTNTSWKTNNSNKIYVETGDEVTYKIKLINKDNTTIKVHQIKEEFDSNKLEFISSNNGSMGIDGTINLSSAIEMPGNDSNDSIELKFKVKEKGTIESVKNTISIESVKLTNKNGYEVSDNSTGDNKDSDYIYTKEYKVSLRKYVTKVTDIYGGNETTYTREHLYGVDEKRDDNQVEVEQGDIVTYKLILKNTATHTGAESQKTTVAINEITESFDDLDPDSITVISGNGGGSYNKTTKVITFDNPIVLNIQEETEVYISGIIAIPESQTNSSQIVKNTATITGIENKHGETVDENDEADDNSDSDWVHTQIYKVSLEKFIVEVAHAAGDVSYYNETQRANEQTHKPSSYKQNNKVECEIGDTIKYTIRLRNDGDTAVKISQIEEETLQYLDPNSITVTGNGGGSFDTTNKIITFNNPTLIPAGGDPIDVTVTATVDVETALSDSPQTVINTASIEQLKNRNDYVVLDSTTGDNRDSDWAITKTYAVSLEKFIVKVAHTSGTATYSNNTERADKEIYRPSDYKESNKVDCEVGDLITYTIRLRNNEDTAVKISKIKEDRIDFIDPDSITVSGNGGGSFDTSTNVITFNNPTLIDPGDYLDVTVVVKVKVEESLTVQKQIVINTSSIEELKNRNDWIILDTTLGDNRDTDWAKTRIYDVSLEKYVSAVNGNPITDRNGKPEYDYPKTQDGSKFKNAVTVSNGDRVTYSIVLNNDSEDTAAMFTEITDILPEGVEYNSIIEKQSVKLTSTSSEVIAPGGSTIINVTVKVVEPSISLRILENEAEITQMKNENGEKIKDVSVGNDDDRDYIQLNYGPDEAIISGKVWNDMALDKTGTAYNALYDSGDEKLLKGIKVYLYRKDGARDIGKIAVTTTDSNGYYAFSDSSLDTAESQELEGNQILDLSERYIKAARLLGENSWKGSHYSYYIVFEYDGVTYTSTPDGKTFKQVTAGTNYNLDSNAREMLKEPDRSSFNGSVEKSRTDFNDQFSTINNATGIKYYTLNKTGYIPQSINITNKNITIESSTELIVLDDEIQNILEDTTKPYADRLNIINTKLDQLANVDLGLRGRDVFDLELMSEVVKTEVIVNGVSATYEYSNKVEIRVDEARSAYNANQDTVYRYDTKMADGKAYVDDSGKSNLSDRLTVRHADTTNSSTNYSKDYGLEHVYVTYKITVTNASSSLGYASKIRDYFDKKYTKNVSYYFEGNGLTSATKNVTASAQSNYKYVDITILETDFDDYAEGNEMCVYVTLELENAAQTLNGYADSYLPTYNMAEIYEYKTFAKRDGMGNALDESTRGLIDKDSAPGSVATEKVRLTTNESNLKQGTAGNPTTVEYYFAGTELTKLKYEDDTYAAPTLYLYTTTDPRTLTGNVFEDYTQLNSSNVRSGNGKRDAIEPGILGVKVQLMENVTETDYNNETNAINKYKDSSGNYYVARFTKGTDNNGNYSIVGYWPGNYIIRYIYGNEKETFYVNATNKKSYNGEDFQATNNSVDVAGMTVNKLDKQPTNYWYIFNEGAGISTGSDDAPRRKTVTNTVYGYNNQQIKVLNNVRDGKVESEANVTYIDTATGATVTVNADDIMKNTYMYAITPTIRFEVEKVEKKGATSADGINKIYEYKPYDITDMNFGIAEVPITTIDLEKHVQSFTILDSAKNNVMASAKIKMDETTKKITDATVIVKPKDEISDVKKSVVEQLLKDEVDPSATLKNKEQKLLISGELAIENLKKKIVQYSVAEYIEVLPEFEVTYGNILIGTKNIEGTKETVLDVSIEDEKLQGAKLEVTYKIIANIYTEKNFDTIGVGSPSIVQIIDCIDNDLSYYNSAGWVPTNSEDIYKIEKAGEYATIVVADSNPVNFNELLSTAVGVTKESTITLERVLTSTDATIEDIITSSIDAYEYENKVRITKLNYDGMKQTVDGTEIIFKDRVRTPDRYIILPGVDHDTATSEIIAIHPPTGDSGLSINYYIIAAIGLVILAIGAFGIKKFVVKK